MLGFAPRGSQPVCSNRLTLFDDVVGAVRRVAARCLSGFAYLSTRLSGFYYQTRRL